MAITTVLTAEPALHNDMADYYYDRPVEFVEDNILGPAQRSMPGIELTHHQKDLLNAIAKDNRVAIESGHGCHAAGTEVLMWPYGKKRVEDIVVGDTIMGDDSFPRVVLKLWRGQEEMAEVRYRNGESYTVNMSHKLCVIATQNHGKQKNGQITEVPVREYLGWSERRRRTNIGYKKSVHYSVLSDMPIDPYLLGLWLGDGDTRGGKITNPEKEIHEYLYSVGAKRTKNAGCPSFRVPGLTTKLKEQGLKGNKHIPDWYLYSSWDDRQQLLAGLLDTDGYLGRSGYEITQKVKPLAHQIVFLARSLGYNATIKKVRKQCCNTGVWGTYYRISIMRNVWKVPVAVKRKKAKRPKCPQRTSLNYAIAVIPQPVDDYYGFTLSGNGRYLLSDCTVTRNTGKSTSMAFAGLWFLATRHDITGPLTKIPVIAPTFHQLYDIIWPEFRRWIPLSRLNEVYLTKSDEVFIRGYKDVSFIRARSPREPDNVQGFHAAHLLWLCDEAFGVTDELVWETIEGSLTEADNRIIIAGQHTVMVGYCHDAFNRDRDSWHCLRFDSTESPLAKKDYAVRIARKYGKDSPIYRVRVRGMDPGDNPDSFLSIADVQAAQNRAVPIEGQFQMGVDCARFGDDLTVVTTAIGNHVFPQRFKSKTDTDDIVDLVLQEVRWIRRKHGIAQTCHVKVDATGGYGAGTIDALAKNTEDNIIVIPVNFSEAGNDEYHDKISLMWGEIKSKLPYLHLPDCDFLYEELVTRSYKLDSKSRVQIEPKKDFKKDHESSPDRSDSLALALTSKAPAQRVLRHYVSTNPKFRRNFDIDFAHTDAPDAHVYGVFVREPDTSISGNWFFWGRRSRILRVYAEWVHPTPIVEYTIAHALTLCRVPLVKKQNEVCIQKVWGNEEMFKDGKNLARLMRKAQLNIKQNVGYNEPAAIARVNSMFSEGAIIVHYTDCPETDRQYRTWRVENGQPVKGYPLCRALCILISELKAAGELDEKPPLPPYSPRKYKLREKLRKGQFGDLPTQQRRAEDWLAA